MSSRVVLVALLVLLVPLSVQAEEPATIRSMDEQRLRTAGLEPVATVLLPLVRTPSPGAVARITTLLADLDDDDFERRQQAGIELVRLGRPARDALAQLPPTASVDLRRQARLLIDAIDNRFAPTTILAILRTLCRQNHPEAAALVLEHLPTFATTHGLDLVAALMRTDPTSLPADAALRRALVDADADRRATAGLLLARKGSPEQVEAALVLLDDREPTVRLRTAQGLLGRGDARGLAPLVALLDGPLECAWQAEELLRWAAGTGAPGQLLTATNVQARRACCEAWKQWLAGPGQLIDWGTLRQEPRRPGLFLTCRHSHIELLGSDGTVRFGVESPGGGNYIDAHLLSPGRLLSFDDDEGEVILREFTGKVLWRWKAPRGEIALSLQPVLTENRLIVVTDEQIHELDWQGKHLRSLRLGEAYFTDACLIDAGRFIALTDEGFFVVERTRGTILHVIHIPGRNDLQSSGRLQPLPEGLVALDSRLLDRVVAIAPDGQVTEVGPPAGGQRNWGIVRFRNGNWLVGGTQPSQRLAETTSDGRVVREMLLPTQRPIRVRPVLEELRLGLDDDPPAPFSVDSLANRLASLKVRDQLTRRNAVSVLGQYTEQAAQVIPALVEALDSADGTIQSLASSSLARLGPVALPALRQVLGQGRPTARVEAARGIGKLGPKAALAVPDLVALVRDPAIAKPLRIASCDALSAIGPTAQLTLPVLREALRDAEPVLRRSAALALGALGPAEPANLAALVTALEDPSEIVAVAAATALGRYGPQAQVAVPSFLRILHRANGTRERSAFPHALRRQVLLALTEVGPAASAAVPVLAELVRDGHEDYEIRQLGVRALGRFGPAASEALPALREILMTSDNRSFTLVPVTLQTLTQLRRDGGLEVLLEVARKAPENVRCTTIATLGCLGAEGQAALPLLKELNLTEKSLRVRSAIQRALRRIPTPPVV